MREDNGANMEQDVWTILVVAAVFGIYFDQRLKAYAKVRDRQFQILLSAVEGKANRTGD